MKATTRRSIALALFAMLTLASASARVSFSGTAGFGRFFEMAFGAATEGYSVDGAKAGLNALVDLEDGNMFLLRANAQKAADADVSLMTFNASFYREAELADAVSLFMETGIESHLILTDSVSTELGLACKGGVAVAASDSMGIKLSAGVTDMFYSSAVSSIYGSAKGSVSMIGVNAQLECSYTF